MLNVDCFVYSLAWDHIIDCTLRVYGVAAIHDIHDDSIGHLAIVTEAGLMNALQLYQVK